MQPATTQLEQHQFLEFESPGRTQSKQDFKLSSKAKLILSLATITAIILLSSYTQPRLSTQYKARHAIIDFLPGGAAALPKA